jgi:predicted aspartyl protease
LALIVLIGAASCSVAPDHTVAPAGPLSSTRETRPQALSETIARLWTAGADPELTSTSQRRMLGAVDAIVHARFSAAVDSLTALLDADDDEEVRRDAAKTLGVLYLGLERWEDLSGLIAAHPEILEGPELEELDRVFADALRDRPPSSRRFTTHPARVKTRIHRFGMPLVEVRVNEARQIFVLDTGAIMTILSESTARRAGVERIGTVTAPGHTSTSHHVEVAPGVADKIELGGLELLGHPVAILRDRDLQIKLAGIAILEIEGIIGWPVFRDLVVELDYAGGWTTFREPVVDPDPVPHADPARNLVWLGYPLVIGHSVDGRPLFLGLDTGASASHLRDPIVEKLGLIVREGGRGVALGAGGTEPIPNRTVQDFALIIGRWQFRFPEISIRGRIRSTVLVKADGKLGSDLLADAKVVVDLTNGRFELER